jgi:hypothetical protein
LVSTKFNFSTDLLSAVQFLDSASARNDLLNLASSVIAKAWRLHKARDRSPWERATLRRDLILTIDVFYATRLQVMAADSRFQNNQLFRALLERIQTDVDMLVRHMSQRAKNLREEQKKRKRDGLLVKKDDDSSDSDTEGESSGTEVDREKKAREEREQKEREQQEERDRADKERMEKEKSAAAAAIGSPSVGMPALKSALKNPGAAMATLAASVPATTATVLRAQLPRLVEQVMATMKSQLQDVHSNVKTLHSRLDRLETQLSDTRVLLKAQTDGPSK